MRYSLSIQSAMGDATAAIRQHAMPFCLPMICVGFVARCLYKSTESLSHKTAVVAELVLFFGLSVPVYYWIQAATAEAYLRWQEEGALPSVQALRRVAGYPGALPVALQLALRYVLWGIPGILLGMLMIGAAKVLLHGVLSQAPKYLHTIVEIAAYDALLSQYGFVVFTFVRRHGGKESFAPAVRLARQFWATLALIAVVETVLCLLPNDIIKAYFAEHTQPRWVTLGWACINLLIAGAVYSWYTLFKAALFRQVESTSRSQ